MNSPRHPLSPLLLCGLLLLVMNAPAQAGSATWNLNPVSGDWNTAENWTPATVPNGADDVATFVTSNITSVDFSGFTTLFSIDFSPGADAFTLDVGSSLVEIVGEGIRNNSGIMQTFLIPVEGIIFGNGATAGSQISFTMDGGSFGSAFVAFTSHSRAGSGVYLCKGPTASQTQGGYVAFEDGGTSADHGMFTLEGSSVGRVAGAFILFREGATARFGVFTIGGAVVAGGGAATCTFFESATADNGTFILGAGLVSGAEGGMMTFYDDSTGGRASVQLLGNSELDISAHNAPGMTIGSIEGHGLVVLGANNLTVGSNDLSTTFSGLIQDGGSFTKTGTGTLTLTGANTYAGGTTIENGKLVVNNVSGSGTGRGAVQVNSGVLGGKGNIEGPVAVGTGSGTGAVLAPGRSGGKPDTLTVKSELTFNSDATYNCGLNTKSAKADQVVANGVTVNNAHFSLLSRGGLALQAGTVLTVINNIAATPIAGTFANLPDGSTFTTHGNTFQPDYQGGDGNDLTLTVQ